MTQTRYAPLATFAVFAIVAITSSDTVAAQAPIPQFEETVVIAVNAPVRTGGPGDYFMTFGGPVRVPGASLNAGTYLFTFPSPDSPGTLRVSSADRAVVHAMFSTTDVSDYTRDARSSSVITWRPQQAGLAPSIASWFPAGSSRGWRFLYQ
jgi:hypothetical protein